LPPGLLASTQSGPPIAPKRFESLGRYADIAAEGFGLPPGAPRCCAGRAKGQGLDGTSKDMGKRFADNGPRGVVEEEEPDNGREAVGG